MSARLRKSTGTSLITSLEEMQIPGIGGQKLVGCGDGNYFVVEELKTKPKQCQRNMLGMEVIVAQGGRFMKDTVNEEGRAEPLISRAETGAPRPDKPKSLAMQIEIEGPVLSCVYFLTCFSVPPPPELF